MICVIRGECISATKSPMSWLLPVRNRREYWLDVTVLLAKRAIFPETQRNRGRRNLRCLRDIRHRNSQMFTAFGKLFYENYFENRRRF